MAEYLQQLNAAVAALPEVRELLTERQMPVRDCRIETSIPGGEVQLIQITLKKKLHPPQVR